MLWRVVYVWWIFVPRGHKGLSCRGIFLNGVHTTDMGFNTQGRDFWGVVFAWLNGLSCKQAQSSGGHGLIFLKSLAAPVSLSPGIESGDHRAPAFLGGNVEASSFKRVRSSNEQNYYHEGLGMSVVYTRFYFSCESCEHSHNKKPFSYENQRWHLRVVWVLTLLASWVPTRGSACALSCIAAGLAIADQGNRSSSALLAYGSAIACNGHLKTVWTCDPIRFPKEIVGLFRQFLPLLFYTSLFPVRLWPGEYAVFLLCLF